MRKFFITIAALAVILLSSCTRQIGWVGLNYQNTIDATYHLFDGKKSERIQVNAGDTFTLAYDIEVDDGVLSLALTDPEREVVWEAAFLEDDEDSMTIRAEKSGSYTLRITGDQTQGGFDLRWETAN